jgi:DNA invertase Pin-like site-specific DNA recombinase
MKKNAAIYVRTSSERQGEKSSPSEQEGDCRQFAEEHDLTIVNVYRDIERYRVKNKIIDPSGTRYDRPGLLAMLRDAAQGGFDVILAWREDRLYRGMRAMLLVLETIQEYKLTVMLARETFDPKIAPLKAWVAQMELEGIKERMTMGVKGRLRAGMAIAGQDRYGYRRNGGRIEVVEDEAKWVRQIFAWYNQRVPLMEIRRRLIEAKVPQKGGPTPRRMEWNRNVIQGILGAAKEYALGLQEQSRAGEIFTIPSEPIIDLATYETALQVRRANKNHPARHVKKNYLIGGLLYCACGRKWGARTNPGVRHNQAGQPIEYGRYYCTQPHADRISPDCPRTVGSIKSDDIAWEKVCAAINKPEILLTQARKTIKELQDSASALSDEQERIQKELDALTLERQWVITQARKDAITESDMDYQLGALTLQELTLKRDLASIGIALDVNSIRDWEARISEYFADLQAGIASLNTVPQCEEERQEVFEIKKQIVNTLVGRVTIDRDRNLHVEIRIDLSKIFSVDPSTKDDPDNKSNPPNGFEGKHKDKIKTTGIYPGRCDDSRPTASPPHFRTLARPGPSWRHGLPRHRPRPRPPRRPQTNPPRMQIHPRSRRSIRPTFFPSS